MKVFLTGGSGMLGKNIIHSFKSEDFNIIAPSRKELNLLSYKSIVSFIKDIKPDIVLHLAAKVGGIEANIREPLEFLIKNLDINKNLILASNECKVKKLINVGSSCMYPRSANNPLKEESLNGGQLEPTNEGYAMAKLIGLKLCEMINNTDDYFNYKTIIPCNLFGKYDNYNKDSSHLIASIIKKIHSAKLKNKNEVTIWGSGNARREFMFASDLADFIINAIIRFQDLPSIINIGTGKDFTVNQYYEKIAKILKYRASFFSLSSTITIS